MKERITVTLENELLEWIDRKVSEKVFASRSHGFEFLIKHAASQENENKNNNHA